MAQENKMVKASNGSAAFVSKFTAPEMKEIEEYAFMFLQSGMFADVQSITQAMVKIKAGREMGFGEFTSIAGFHIIKGRVVPGANLMGAKVKGSGKYDYDVMALDEQHCIIQFYRVRGDKWETMSIPVEYTVEKAAKAGLTSNPTWKAHPEDMLMASALRKGARRYCPELLAGLGADTDEFDGVVIEGVDVPAEAASAPADVDGEIVEETEAPAVEAEAVEEAPTLLEHVEAGLDNVPTGKDAKAILDKFGITREQLADADEKTLGGILFEVKALADKGV